MRKIAAILEDGIDQMKTSAEDVEVVLVGGGSIIAPETLKGVKHITKSDFGGVANAIGATIASIGGEYEKVYQYAHVKRLDALSDVEKQAGQ